MIIEGSFYRLTQIDDSTPRYDLELLRHISGKNSRDEFKNDGYGMTLEYCIHKIIVFAVNQNLPEKVTLKEYLDEYKKVKDSIQKDITG